MTQEDRFKAISQFNAQSLAKQSLAGSCGCGNNSNSLSLFDTDNQFIQCGLDGTRGEETFRIWSGCEGTTL